MKDSVAFRTQVEKIVKTGLNGRQFFEQVDALCLEYADLLIKSIPKKYKTCVITGSFGEFLFEHGFLQDFNYAITIPGGLRLDGNTVGDEDIFCRRNLKTNPPEMIPPLTAVVFIDDSIYSGITRARCASWVTRLHRCLVVDSYVLYDGSPIKTSESIYRYWDHHPPELQY